MRLLTRFDQWLIATIERICHKFQRLTGKTNYWVAGKMFLLVAAAMCSNVIRDLSEYYARPIRTSWSEFVLSHIIDVYLMFVSLDNGLAGWKRQEAEAFQRLARGVANPMKIVPAMVTLRVFMILILLLVSYICYLETSLIWPAGSIMIAITAIVHLYSCDPLPPCSGTIRELFSSWFMPRNLVPVPEGSS